MYASKLERVNFSFCEMNGVNIASSSAKYAEFSWAKMNKSNLSSGDFSSALFDGAFLRFADLQGSKFNAAEFSDADLTGANLRWTDLSKTIGITQKQIDLACINEDTKLPHGLEYKYSCVFDGDGEVVVIDGEPERQLNKQMQPTIKNGG